MTGVFVTGTGTDIGKTFVAAGLVRELRRRGHAVEALKPVMTGFASASLATSDAGLLLAALGRPVTLDEAAKVAPWRYAAPLSPHMAAPLEGQNIDFAALVAFSQSRSGDGICVIEGVGGIMVPLDASHTTLDWLAALNVPAILVAGSYLGAISHTLSALAVLKTRGIAVKAVVVSESADSIVSLEATMQTIIDFAAPALTLALPRREDIQAGVFATLAEAVAPH